jgi:hypothetical protein
MVAKYPAIPEPTLAVESLRDSVLSIKQAFEILTGQRGNPNYAAITVETLPTMSVTWFNQHTFDSETDFEGQAVSPLQTLTDGATISVWDCAQGQKAKVTLGGNRTMPAPINFVEGTTYFLWVIQDATGTRGITSWNSVFDFGTAGAPTLTAAANKADLMTFEAINIAGTLRMRYTGIAKGFS